MFISFTTTNSYTDNSLIKTLLSWRLYFFIIFILFALLVLFLLWKQYVRNSFVNKNLKQSLVQDYPQPLETITVDTIRKIPLQTSASKRTALVSKPLRTNNKKSSTLSSSRSNKSRRTAKTSQPVNSSSTIKISLIISKENNDSKDAKPIDQTLTNISLLTIHGIEGLKSKCISPSMTIELPSIDLSHDTSNQTESMSPNSTSKQQIAKDFKNNIHTDHSTETQ